MTPSEKKFLLDIKDAISNVDVHLEGRRVFDEFTSSLTKRRAVEREIEIIGEATNNLLKLAPGIMLSSARQIVNMRNRVIHAYDNVDETILWKVVMKDLPVLYAEVTIFLDGE